MKHVMVPVLAVLLAGAGGGTAAVNRWVATADVAAARRDAPATPAFIGGPSTIKPSASCWWIAGILDDDNGPHTYSWSQSAGTGTSYGSTYQASSASSFTLYLTVVDAYGNISTASKNVTVASNAGACPSI